MTIDDLDAVLYEQFVQDAAGLLSWLDDQVEADVPTDEETARAVAEDFLDPKWIFWTGPPQDDSMDEIMDLVKESRLLRLTMARSALYRWAREVTQPLIPEPRGPTGPTPTGPPR